jgi:hypothetical protein
MLKMKSIGDQLIKEPKCKLLEKEGNLIHQRTIFKKFYNYYDYLVLENEHL